MLRRQVMPTFRSAEQTSDRKTVWFSDAETGKKYDDAWGGKKTKTWSARSKCDDSRVFPEEHGNGVWWIGMLELESLDRDEAEEGWRSVQCSQAGQVVITVLQVLVTLVAARVSWGVSQEATPVQQQLLLWAFRLTASLWVAASCNAQRRHQGHDSQKLWLPGYSFRWPVGGNYSDLVRRKNTPLWPQTISWYYGPSC